MPKRVEFNGQVHEFPDDFTDEEIAAALSNEAEPAGAAAASGAEAISETPAFGQNIKLGGLLGPTVGDAELPFSPSDIAEAIPSGLSAIGAALGRAPGAALGGSLGELLRQGVRKAAGYTPAPGTLQEIAGVDPGSLEASLLGVAGEGLAGAGSEVVGRGLAATSPSLRESGLRTYAGLLNPRSERELAKGVERLRPIQEELPLLNPISPRKKLERIAEKKSAEVGAKVGKLYDVPTPSSFKPAIRELEQLASKQVRTPTQMVTLPAPRQAGLTATPSRPVQMRVDPDLIDPELHKALTGRAAALEQAEGSRSLAIPQQPITLSDLFKARQAAGTRATRATQQAFAAGKATKELQPRVQAFKAEQQAISKTMQSQVPGGKEADELFSAWKTLEKAGQKEDAGTFLQRWLFARLIPGPIGTVGGASAAQTAFWRSLGAKSQRGLASALEAGDKTKFLQLLRGAAQASGEEDD